MTLESRENTEFCQVYTVARVQGDIDEPGMMKLHGRIRDEAPISPNK